MKLLLFDIDGTLLTTRGTGRRAVAQALAAHCGRPLSTDGISFSGKTDPQIIHEILDVNGIGMNGDRHALVQEITDTYASLAAASITPAMVEVLPGVGALLNQLQARSDVQLALLTGNLEPTAYLKLQAAALDHYFPFGAFGSDHADRHQLPAIAVDRAAAHTGHRFAGKEVVIIGDTEHDLCCGQALGVFAVGVCTGRYSAAELARHDPDLLLNDLCDANQFMERVLASS